MTDRIVIVGGGIAGLATALRLAPLPVMLLAGAKLATGAATAWAQGGIAAAIGPGDAPANHAADTLKAGAGIGDPAIVRKVTESAPAAIDWLAAMGTEFDRDARDVLALGLEAAHGQRRIVHARGDATGFAVLETLIASVRRCPSIEIREEARATDLVRDRDGTVAGLVVDQAGRREFIAARAIVLATGGLGGLYAHTTNPLSAIGSGVAMAARAGAVLRDMEFVQFHPTAMALRRDPMPLATEALRGEGAILVNGKGERFMRDVPGAELAPRDVVARAIWAELVRGEKVFLDGRAIAGIERRFPSVTAQCRAAGLDPASSPIPVRPAAHYHMGGIMADGSGRTSLPGLWACGEVAATGFHGANRLASNSLLEGLAFARWIADDIRDGRARKTSPVALPRGTRRAEHDLRSFTETRLGVIRDERGIVDAIHRFSEEDGDRAVVGLLIAASAWSRRESRGGHFRSDHIEPRPEFARSSEITLAQAQALAAELTRRPAAMRQP